MNPIDWRQIDSQSPESSKARLQAVYRLQGELRSLDRQQSTKILIKDCESLEALIQK